MKELFMIGVGAALINNVVLSQFLGICAFLGVSRKTGTAAGMGAAVIFVITLSSLLTGILYRCVLVPLHVEYLQTIVFILIIAALVQFVEMALKKYSHALYEALGDYLPLITTNCAVLGVAPWPQNTKQSWQCPPQPVPAAHHPKLPSGRESPLPGGPGKTGPLHRRLSPQWRGGIHGSENREFASQSSIAPYKRLRISRRYRHIRAVEAIFSFSRLV